MAGIRHFQTVKLIDEAKRNGGSDNIAVIVIDPFDVEVN